MPSRGLRFVLWLRCQEKLHANSGNWALRLTSAFQATKLVVENKCFLHANSGTTFKDFVKKDIEDQKVLTLIFDSLVAL